MNVEYKHIKSKSPKGSSWYLSENKANQEEKQEFQNSRHLGGKCNDSWASIDTFERYSCLQF